MIHAMQIAQYVFTVLTFASILASLWGLQLALRALNESRQQSKNLEKLLDSQNSAQESIQRVANSLTTRQIGVHPEYMSYVQDIVLKSQHDLLVMSSVPGFGIFTAVHQCEDLQHSLKKAQLDRGVRVKLLTGSAISRRKRLHFQFGDAINNWESWIAEGENKARLDAFCAFHQLIVPSRDQFSWLEEHLIEINDKIREDVYFRGQKFIADDFLSVMAWIADGKYAVFAFSNQKGNFPGFYTEDPYIIESLNGFAERIIENATNPTLR